MQNDLDRESSSLQDLESQKQDAQERLEEMDQQRSKLEGMLNDVKQKCQEETQTVTNLTYSLKNKEFCCILFWSSGDTVITHAVLTKLCWNLQIISHTLGQIRFKLNSYLLCIIIFIRSPF